MQKPFFRLLDNLFLGLPRTSKILSKYGPVALQFITKMLQKIQEKYGDILETYYLCKYGTRKLKMFENVCTRYHVFFEISSISFFEYLIFIIYFTKMRVEK